MQPSIPVFATVISVALGLEKLNTYKVLGILAAVGGAVLIEVWNPTDEEVLANFPLSSIFCLGYGILN